MGLKEIMDRLKGIENPEEEIDDNVTRDKQLRSMRRERRIQMEEIEKEQLKIKIADFKRERTRKHLFGIKEGIKERIAVKKKEVLSEGVSLLSGKRRDKPKHQSFLGKSNL